MLDHVIISTILCVNWPFRLSGVAKEGCGGWRTPVVFVENCRHGKIAVLEI